MEKVYEISEKTKLTYGRGYVYSLQYHLIWCTKYRKKVLTDGIDIQCKEMLTELADQYSF
ncbi:MAG: transposase, partial [Hungatella hathewayi]|nr:transposase [Hungatella hathewayi]MBS5241604.1 transposase [Hungatella hathewayi]MDU0928949.1 transposase [Hungatella hathewayi]MDU0932002.1 transposase [Hungatella hathewayi]